MTSRRSLWRKAQTWHALVVAAMQLTGLTMWGWSPLALWLVFLADDLCLAASSWVRTAWANTKANERWLERTIAVVVHALLDSLTLGSLAVSLIIMMPWPEGVTLGSAWQSNIGSDDIGMGVITVLCLTLMQWPAWWRADQSGELPDIDAIRGGSRLLTRYWVANVALLLGLPWLGASTADLVATLALVVLRTAWTVWFDSRPLTGRMG